MAFTNALDGTKQLSVEKIGKVTFDSSSKVNATFESKKENNYYVLTDMESFRGFTATRTLQLMRQKLHMDL